MEQWKEYKLKDLVIVITDKTDTSVLDDYNYISTENMLQNKVGVSKSSGIPAGNCIHFKEDDILISNIRPYFKKIWRANKEGGCSADVICYRANNKVDSLFLYYLMSQDSFFEYVMKGSKGTKMPRGDKKQILQWNISLPPFEQQKKIASILKSLDDKIEVNRRINDNLNLRLFQEAMLLWTIGMLKNDNLEQQAQALFKSWFVDFEPFKDGEFEESEIGMIPRNWSVLSFKDFVEPSKEKAPVDSIPEYSVTNNGIIPRDAKFNKKLSKSTSMNKVLRKDNLVFGMSREILNWGIMEDEIGGVSSAYNIYILNKKLVNPTYLRLYIRARISDFSSLIGTAAREGQGLDKGQLMQKRIYVPTENTLQDFFKLYLPIISEKQDLENQVNKLVSLRDALLPRLMSGELNPSEIHM